MVKEVSQGSGQTKKPAHELKTPSEKVKLSSLSFSARGGDYFVKDKDPVGGIKTVKKRSSESFRVSSVCSQRQVTSQGSCDDRSHHKISSKVKRSVLSEHEQKIQKIFGRTRKLRNEKNCNGKTRKLNPAKSISEKLLVEERGKLLKDVCAKRLRSEAQPSSSSSLSKDTTSGTKRISKAIENTSPVESAPRKSATLESSKQPAWLAEAPSLPNFKIPKMVLHDRAGSAPGSPSSESSNRNCQHANELFKFESVRQSHISCDSNQLTSCDTKNERSSSSSHLPDVSATVTHPWQDEVTNAKYLKYVGT